MNKIKTATILLVALLAVSVGFNLYQYNQNTSLNSQNIESQTKLEISSLLTQTQLQVNDILEKLGRNITSACAQFSKTDLKGSQARSILTNLAESNSLIVDAVTSDTNGVILAVEPSQYSNIEGEDISSQEHIIQMRQTMRPVMSDMILLVEDFYGVVMVAPIFDSSSTFMGSLNIVIQPSELVKVVGEPAVEDKPYTFFAIQTDGRIIYDADAAQIGKMTFSDPAYADFPELLALAQKVSTERSGYGRYQYHETLASQQIVEKEAYWTTIGIYGTEWRLLILHLLN
jgi:hypothetical protein